MNILDPKLLLSNQVRCLDTEASVNRFVKDERIVLMAVLDI